MQGSSGTVFARSYRKRRFCRSGQAPAATRRNQPIAKPFDHHAQGPTRALIAGNRRASAICPAALRLHGPTRSSTCVGLPGTTLARVYRPVFARSCRKRRFCRSGQAPAATRRNQPIAKHFDHHTQGPARGPDCWQPASIGNLPGGATLARAYQEQYLRGPTGNNACTGLAERCLHGPAGNNAFVGRVRRQPPPDETSTIAKPFDHHAQGPARGPDYWQPANVVDLPGGATLARAYQEQYLRGPTGNNACTGLPERHLHDPAGNDTFVGRVRRQPPPDTGHHELRR